MTEAEGSARYVYEDGAWFITLIGQVRHPLGPALNALLDRAFAEPNAQRFVIDLSQADSIDSTCLGVLARIVNQKNDPNAQRPVIITGGEDMSELLLAVCFDRLFDLVESADGAQGQLQMVPSVNMGEEDMLSLLLESHQRLCTIDAKTHAIFKDVVEALEFEVVTNKAGSAVGLDSNLPPQPPLSKGR
jgi:anti-anti-sigma factor